MFSKTEDKQRRVGCESRTVREVLNTALDYLNTVCDSPRVDAEILLAFILQQSRTYLYMHPEYTLTEKEYQDFFQCIHQRETGYPVAYLTHQQGFWDCDLFVNEHTLIPRPETELLVDLVLADPRKNLRILDLGTGSGAIAIAIAKSRCQDSWHVTATDISSQTLDVAKHNAQNLGITNIDFIKSHWFDNIPPQHFDLIISNPPYLSESDPHLSQGDLRFEPRGALACSEDGYAAFSNIINHAKTYLCDDGILILEHGFEQQEKLLSMLTKDGYQDCEGFVDLNAQPRVVRAHKSRVK